MSRLSLFLSSLELRTYHSSSLVRSRKRYAKLPTSEPPVEPLPVDLAPGVSILRPLRGLDTNLYENLEASFVQDYPKFEIIFSVADESDAAIPIVEELKRLYPQVEAKILVGMRRYFLFVVPDIDAL